MSKELRKQLIITYIILVIISFSTGLLGYSIHKLDVPSIILLVFFFVAFSSIWTCYSIKSEKDTNERLHEVREDLQEHSLLIIKNKADSYTVFDITNTDVIEDVTLSELEAFRDGVSQGMLMAYKDMSEPEELDRETDTDMEARLAIQSAQHEEDKNYYSQWGLHEDE